MKIYLCMLMLIIPLLMFAQEVKSSDAIIGKWWTKGNKSIVEIYKEGNEFKGQIKYLKTPLDEQGNVKTDPKNPKPELKSRKRLGMIVMSKVVYKGDKEWGKGTIYDPESGNSYSCSIKMKGKDTLLLHGYLGVSILGRTETWLRAK